MARTAVLGAEFVVYFFIGFRSMKTFFVPKSSLKRHHFVLQLFSLISDSEGGVRIETFVQKLKRS